jgi:hypothetical protein
MHAIQCSLKLHNQFTKQFTKQRMDSAFSRPAHMCPRKMSHALYTAAGSGWGGGPLSMESRLGCTETAVGKPTGGVPPT